MTAPSPLDRELIEAGAKACARTFGFGHHWANLADSDKDHWRGAYVAVIALLIERGVLPRTPTETISSPEEGT